MSSAVRLNGFGKGNMFYAKTEFIQKISTIFQLLSRTTLDFQGPTTRNIISQIVQKCTFLA